MRSQPQVVNLRIEDGEPCVARAGVAQYPDAIVATKVDLVFGFEVARLAALQLVEGLLPPQRFSEAVSFRIRNGFEVEKNCLGGLFIRWKNLESGIEASCHGGRGQHSEIHAV